MDDEGGKKMSLYGKSDLSPGELAGLWKNVLKRTEMIRRNHLVTKGDGSAHWPGIKTWSKHQLQDMKDTFCGKRTRPTVADVSGTYDRLFHPCYDFDQKIHRDDRKHVLQIGRAVYDEEKHRPVPTLSSSLYGKRLDSELEPFCRGHVRIEHVLKGFSHRRGTHGIPPVDKRSE
ncbi:hypothetical protein FSP39_020713 [Pinctada imbricata]|uniref:Uncharacterized protein n=1 Tax=Pinctada imbricata TaxID=66713 RepID=A0AA88XJX1_PINIB|nr:hypothetical protein FSP39_020713 [Pinctada imbricata]